MKTTYEIRIETDNAAFEGDDLGNELARILKIAAIDIKNFPEERQQKPLSLRDYNGNRVGVARFI